MVPNWWHGAGRGGRPVSRVKSLRTRVEWRGRSETKVLDQSQRSGPVQFSENVWRLKTWENIQINVQLNFRLVLHASCLEVNEPASYWNINGIHYEFKLKEVREENVLPSIWFRSWRHQASDSLPLDLFIIQRFCSSRYVMISSLGSQL